MDVDNKVAPRIPVDLVAVDVDGKGASGVAVNLVSVDVDGKGTGIDDDMAASDWSQFLIPMCIFINVRECKPIAGDKNFIKD